MFYYEKVLIIGISIVIVTFILIFINNMIYGTETRYIADYMPGGLEEEYVPWRTAVARALFRDIWATLIIDLFLTISESKILSKNKILGKDKLSYILKIMLIVIPIVISTIVLSGTYGCTY